MAIWGGGGGGGGTPPAARHRGVRWLRRCRALARRGRHGRRDGSQRMPPGPTDEGFPRGGLTLPPGAPNTPPLGSPLGHWENAKERAARDSEMGRVPTSQAEEFTNEPTPVKRKELSPHHKTAGYIQSSCQYPTVLDCSYRFGGKARRQAHAVGSTVARSAGGDGKWHPEAPAQGTARLVKDADRGR